MSTLTLRPISTSNALPNRPTSVPSIDIHPSTYVVHQVDIAPTVEVPLRQTAGRHPFGWSSDRRGACLTWAVVGEYGRRGADTLSRCETCAAPIAEGDLVVAERSGYMMAPTVQQNYTERGWDHMRCRHDLYERLGALHGRRAACKPAAPRKAPKDYTPTSIALHYSAACEIVTQLTLDGMLEAKALAVETAVSGYPSVRGAGSLAILKAVGADRALALAAEALR